MSEDTKKKELLDGFVMNEEGQPVPENAPGEDVPKFEQSIEALGDALGIEEAPEPTTREELEAVMNDMPLGTKLKGVKMITDVLGNLTGAGGIKGLFGAWVDMQKSGTLDVGCDKLAHIIISFFCNCILKLSSPDSDVGKFMRCKPMRAAIYGLVGSAIVGLFTMLAQSRPNMTLLARAASRQSWSHTLATLEIAKQFSELSPLIEFFLIPGGNAVDSKSK